MLISMLSMPTFATCQGQDQVLSRTKGTKGRKAEVAAVQRSRDLVLCLLESLHAKDCRQIGTQTQETATVDAHPNIETPRLELIPTIFCKQRRLQLLCDHGLGSVCFLGRRRGQNIRGRRLVNVLPGAQNLLF